MYEIPWAICQSPKDANGVLILYVFTLYILI